MKILRAIAFIIFSMMVGQVMGQGAYADFWSGQGSGSTININQPVTFSVRPFNGCQLTVKNWYISPAPVTSPASNAVSASLKWDHEVSNAMIYVTYVCNALESSREASPRWYLNVANLNPSFDFGIFPTTVCEGQSVTGTVSNIQNADRTNVTPNVLATWKWETCIGSTCSTVYNGTDKSPRSVLINNKDITSVKVTMSSAVTGTNVSKQANVTVNAKKDFTIGKIILPGVICKNDQGNTKMGASVNVTTDALGPFRYRWYINGGDADPGPCPNGSPCPQDNPSTHNYFTYQSVNKNDHVSVQVIDDSGNNCRVAATKTTAEEVVDITDNSFPTVQIVYSRTDGGSPIGVGSAFCPGDKVYIRSSQSGSAYHWHVTGYTDGTIQAKSFSMTAGPSDYNESTYISLSVDGVSASGTCIVQNTTAGPTNSINEHPINPLPNSTINPSGFNLIKSYESRTLTAPASMTSYQWYEESPLGSNTFVPMTNNSNTTSSISSIAIGKYKVKVTDVLGCTAITPTATEIKRNTLPTVNAGPDTDFTQPATPGVTQATATDAEGAVTLAWTKVSAPTGPTLLNPTTANVSVGGAIVGTYVLRLTATDGLGESSYDDVKLRLYPADNYNYVRENGVTVSGVTTTSQASALNIGDRLQTTTYYDGLGRPLQKVDMKVTPGSKDLTQSFEYDQYNREPIKYLPFPTAQNTGNYLPNTVKTTGGVYNSSPQQQYYNSRFSEPNGYAESGFDNSPLNKIVEQGAPGADWQIGQHTITKGYTYNIVHEVLNFTYVSSTGEIKLPALTSSDAAYYSANTLFCNTTKDEQLHEVREYTDREGRLICKKVEAPGGAFASTYYLYDEMGNLVVVIPPEGVQRVIETN